MGRGSSGISGGWAKELRAAAKKGQMPAYIMGNREQQAQVFEEIDRLYPMPDNNARITDQGSGVWVMVNGGVSRQNYPSGERASEAERNGVLKFILYNALNKA